MNRQILIGLLLSTGVLVGCAPMSPLVKLSPAAPASIPEFKNRPSLFLTVVDARSSDALGLLPARPNQNPVAAKAAVAVEEVIRRHLVSGLTHSGFQVLSAPTATSAQLVVQVKRLDFKLEKSGLSSEIAGAGSLAVAAKFGSSTREKTYSAENGQKWALSPPVDGHEKYLNLLLTDLLNTFLTDEKFLSFLAGRT